ncbi:MAG: DUF5687 family protein [Rhodothermales bacterium]
MIYFALLRNHWKNFGRSFQGKRLWLTLLGVLPVVTYVVIVLVSLGIFFDKIIHVPRSDLGPVSALNSHLFTGFFGMFTLRFFFQRPPRMETLPYLHLPIQRSQLIRYFQVISLVSIHNLYPLFFFLPFWINYGAKGPLGPTAAFFWFAGIVLCLLLSHYLNTLLRIAVDRYAKVLLFLLIALIAAQVLDEALGAHLVTRMSSLYFDALAQSNLAALSLLAAVTLATFLISNRVLLLNLGRDRSATAQQRTRPSFLSFSLSPIRNLIIMEMMMMWRNKRTKQYVVISIGVSTAYTALLLSDFNAIFGSLMAAAVGLFASGVFALNYGQLMFAWESRYFDGILARNIPLQHMILSKFMVLQGSCLFLFIVSLPLFFWLAPNLLMLHVAFLFYNAGVTSILMLALAVLNRKRVNSAEGSFFNYQGFSVLHWFWIIPTIIPPAILLFFLEGAPETALSIIALLGLMSMLLTWPLSLLLARFLARRKYMMAVGFRTIEQ